MPTPDARFRRYPQVARWHRALIGLGIGASVSPALFSTGFSLHSAQIQRVFALVELLRGVTAFLAAPPALPSDGFRLRSGTDVRKTAAFDLLSHPV